MAKENIPTSITDDIAAKVTGGGMPVGNDLTPLIAKTQIEVKADGTEAPAFDDNAAATIVWMDFNRSMQWLDSNSWLAEWQLIDFLKQSPNYDRDWRMQTNRAARLSRFNVAKNSNTMSTQIRRGVFADTTPFELEATGKFAGLDDVETYLDAITEIFTVLSRRAELEYNMENFIDSQVLQGTAIAIPIWEEREVIRRQRVRDKAPARIAMPDGTTRIVHTKQSDKYKVRETKVMESWPCFEYRRLGTTIYDPKWRTPNRPDLSAAFRIDVDYVTLQDLLRMRDLDCYKDIPDRDELLTWFTQNAYGDAEAQSQVAESMNVQTATVLHASGEHKNTSVDPTLKPVMKIAYWTAETVKELLVYPGGHKIIRNEPHDILDYALGFSATWWNIDNSGYGMGVGRLNAGDQRMDQGVLNEVLKMIAFPLNAPILYNSASGNAPTQNLVTGAGTFLPVDLGDINADVNKAFGWMKMPEIPDAAWKLYELGKEGGEDLVGANATTMQGNVGGPGSTALRTAAGVNRIGGKADENIATPVKHLEYVLERWYGFLWHMVCEVMPVTEIREILSEKFGDAILALIDSEILLNATFNIKILAGQKLAARAAVAQIIPFLLQLVQQPQLLQYMHEKGWTINFLAIEKIFLRVSELKGAEDIIVPLTADEKQQVAAMNPNAMKAQLMQLVENLRGQNKLQAIAAQGKTDIATDLVSKTAEAALGHAEGSVPLDLAEARLSRNTDMGLLQTGAVQ